MYESFFSLDRKPFELLPNPDFLYLSRSHKKALTFLDYGIREKAGFILLTGEVGSGKTTLVRNMVRQVRTRAPLSIVFNTRVDSEQLISLINDDFGLETAGKDKVALVRDLNGFLISEFRKGQQPILIIDEAQNLTAEHLEEVRLLSNLETEKAKLLQIILVGQPELRNMLARPELRQLRQRISISCHLSPLSLQETESYVLHRLEIAGNREAIGFSEDTLAAVHAFSRGIPRLTNIVCDYLLLAAFADDTREISPELVSEVLEDIEINHSYWTDSEVSSGDATQSAVLPANAEDLSRIHQRLDQLDRMLAGREPVEEFQTEVFEKITQSNQYVTGVFDRYRQEFTRMSAEIGRVTEEVERLKQLHAGQESDENVDEIGTPEASHADYFPKRKNEKPAGFLRRIFGS